MMKLNIRSSFVGISMLAIAVLPAVSLANENSADVNASVHANGGLQLGELAKNVGHFAARAFEGTVASVNGNGAFTVTTGNSAANVVQTNASTSFKMRGNENASVADVIQGIKIAVKGMWDSTHSVFTATKVAIVTKINPVKDWMANLMTQHVLNGKVTAVSGSTITVQGNNGTVYTVQTASAKVYARGFALVSVGDVKVGDRVEVLGTISATSATAEIISDTSLSK